MRVRGVERAFALQVMARLRSDLGSDLNEDGPDLTAIRAALELALPEPAAAQMQQHAEQAEANLSLSNTITSLRLLGDIVWRALIARTSTLMHEMQASHVFQMESDATQDATLHAIERLARRSGRTELVVARALLESIRTPPQVESLASRADLESPAYWLQRPGPRDAVSRARRQNVAAAELEALAQTRAARIPGRHGFGNRRPHVLVCREIRTADARVARGDGVVRAAARQRSGDRDREPIDQRIGAAATTAEALVDGRHPARAQGARRDSVDADQQRRNRNAGAAPRASLSRQQRTTRPVCAAHRLRRMPTPR